MCFQNRNKLNSLGEIIQTLKFDRWEVSEVWKSESRDADEEAM